MKMKKVAGAVICTCGAIEALEEIQRKPGLKLTHGKIPIWSEFLAQFPEAIEEVAKIGDKGTRAPGHVRGGWRTVPDGYVHYSDAQARHQLLEAIAGQSMDTQEQIKECATACWNNLARLTHLILDSQE